MWLLAQSKERGDQPDGERGGDSGKTHPRAVRPWAVSPDDPAGRSRGSGANQERDQRVFLAPARVTTHRAADPRPWPPPGGSAREGNHPTSSHCKPSEATHYAAAVDRSPGNRPSPRARRRRLVLPPMRGSVSGEAWSFTGRQTPLRIGHPGLVFRPPRQNSPRPQARALAGAASPSKPRHRAGLCRSGAEDMFHERQTQDVVLTLASFSRETCAGARSRPWRGLQARRAEATGP